MSVMYVPVERWMTFRRSSVPSAPMRAMIE
jgi:hypothetical protein